MNHYERARVIAARICAENKISATRRDILVRDISKDEAAHIREQKSGLPKSAEQ